jgi:hypothetical protein
MTAGREQTQQYCRILLTRYALALSTGMEQVQQMEIA